jgi:hypothetical protein
MAVELQKLKDARAEDERRARSEAARRMAAHAETEAQLQLTETRAREESARRVDLELALRAAQEVQQQLQIEYDKLQTEISQRKHDMASLPAPKASAMPPVPSQGPPSQLEAHLQKPEPHHSAASSALSEAATGAESPDDGGSVVQNRVGFFFACVLFQGYYLPSTADRHF